MATRIICDRCDKPFDVDAQPGDKVECPLCHDVNIVRAMPQGRPAQPRIDPAAAAGYPPSDGPEADVMRVRPAMLRSKPWRFFGLWVGIVGGLTSAALLAAAMPPAAIGALVLAVACGALLVVWRIRSMHDGLLITTRRVIDRTGLLSKNTSEIMHRDIRHVVVNQTFWQRIWNVGTLAISTAADEGLEVQMDDVPKPQEIKHVIDLYR